jgi:hypothetical protein
VRRLCAEAGRPGLEVPAFAWEPEERLMARCAELCVAHVISMGAAMSLRRQWAAALAAGMAAVVLAGCGGSVHLSGPVPPPGHQAPVNAVSGLVQHLLAGGNPLTTCSYVDHDEEGNCLDTVGNDSNGGSGTWRPGHSVVSGNEAIVAIELANVCFSSCSTNLNPNAGLPRHGQSFGAAFQRAQYGTGKDYAFDCVRVDGRWYVQLGIPGLI